MLRPMKATDIAEVVSIHMQSFPGFFLTFLGRGFLRLLYQCLQEAEEGVTLVVEEHGQVLGFVAGVTQQRKFYQRLIRQHVFCFAWVATGAIIRRPGILGRLLRALGRPLDSQRSVAEAALMSIAVTPTSAGRGYGRLLVQAFTQQIRQRGLACYCLTTDSHQNERANRFYQDLGFTLMRSFATPEGRLMNEYLMIIE